MEWYWSLNWRGLRVLGAICWLASNGLAVKAGSMTMAVMHHHMDPWWPLPTLFIVLANLISALAFLEVLMTTWTDKANNITGMYSSGSGNPLMPGIAGLLVLVFGPFLTVLGHDGGRLTGFFC